MEENKNLDSENKENKVFVLDEAQELNEKELEIYNSIFPKKTTQKRVPLSPEEREKRYRESKKRSYIKYYIEGVGPLKKKEYYLKNKEKIKERSRKYEQTPERKARRKEYMKEYMKSYYEKFPDKVKQHVKAYEDRKKEEKKKDEDNIHGSVGNTSVSSGVVRQRTDRHGEV